MIKSEGWSDSLEQEKKVARIQSVLIHSQNYSMVNPTGIWTSSPGSACLAICLIPSGSVPLPSTESCHHLRSLNDSRSCVTLLELWPSVCFGAMANTNPLTTTRHGFHSQRGKKVWERCCCFLIEIYFASHFTVCHVYRKRTLAFCSTSLRTAVQNQQAAAIQLLMPYAHKRWRMRFNSSLLADT